MVGVSQLRPYQTKVIDDVRVEIRAGNRWVCCVIPTGGGKTYTAAELVKLHVAQGGRVLWLAHRGELVAQAFDTLKEHGLSVGCISASGIREPNKARPVQVASIDTVIAREIFLDDVTMVVYDECFVAGTDIDGTPIEEIRIGDWVDCVDHDLGVLVRRQVVRLFSKQSHNIWDVVVNGETTTCTGNHPFFVKGKGYVKAENLVPGDLLCLRSGVRGVDGHGISTSEDLREPVFQQEEFGNHGCDEQGARICEDEILQPDAFGSIASQDECYAEVNWAQTYYTGWKRTPSHISRSDHSPSTGVAHRGNSAHKYDSGVRVAESLQAGCGGSGEPDVCGDRWGESLHPRSESSGSEERNILAWARVESVSRNEQASSDGVRVYNFEVAGTHTYFANGILVHNCHHILADTWKAYMAYYRERHVIGIGLTATPARPDGKGLGDMYDSMVIGPTIPELQAAGVLVPSEFTGPGRRLNPGELARSPVDAYKADSPNGKAIVFASNIKAATHFTEEFNAQGIKAGMVTGTMKASDRYRVMADYSNRRIQVLVNVGVATEGYDDPPTDTIILARGIGSYVLYMQIIGRGLRCWPGKTKCTVLDLFGCVETFGPPEVEQEYSLEGEGMTRKGAVRKEQFCKVCGNLMTNGAICEVCANEKNGPQLPHILNIEMKKYTAKLRETPDQRKAYYFRLLAQASDKGYKEGWCAAKYKAIYCVWPPRAWLQEFKNECR